MNKERIVKTAFSTVYPLYVQKAGRKGRTKADVDTLIFWLTGYDDEGLQEQIIKESDFETFFAEAPKINPNASKITGMICGVRVEEIEDPLMQQIRWLDKLVDGLAKGKSLEKILMLPVLPKQDPIGDYIATQAEDIQSRLREVYVTIKNVLPDAQEKISWQMPTFWKGRNIIHFAAFKHHIGLYPGGQATTVFADKLKDYKTSKGAIQLSNNKPLPLELIAEIASWCGEHNLN